MKAKLICLFTLVSLQILAGNGHTSSDNPIKLHVNNEKWPECAIELDPSLSQSDFRRFGQEISSFIRFKAVNASVILKKRTFEIALPFMFTGKIDDSKPYWNNTFTHPDSTHWLVDGSKRIKYPQLNLRYGLSNKMDIGFYIITTPNLNNYGFTGLDLRYAIINDTSKKISLTSRISFGTLLGVKDMDYSLLSGDISASKTFGLFTPYFGLAGTMSYQNEESDVVSLKSEWIPTLVGIVGMEFNYKFISLGCEWNVSYLNMLSIKAGIRF